MGWNNDANPYARTMMYLLLLAILILTAGTHLLVGDDGANRQSTQTTGKVQYTCPMHPDVVSDKPGTCRICGMQLEDRQRSNVAILVFNGVEIVDYTAPYEIFGQQHLNVYTVAANSQPVVTSMNMSVNPQYTLENAPKPFIVVVPGGDIHSALDDPKVIQWIQKMSGEADYVMSVCNGAFLLNKAGLLHGLTATTFHGLIQQLREDAPDTKVVTDKRYVDNGRIITTAGLSSGIDGSLYLLSKIYGMDEARTIALHLEYNWQPDSTFARADMADKFLPELNLDTHVTDVQHVRNLGGMDHWNLALEAKSDLSAADLKKLIVNKLQSATKWVAANTNQASQSAWKFSDEKGKHWVVLLTVQPVAGKDNTYLLDYKIDREGAPITAHS